MAIFSAAIDIAIGLVVLTGVIVSQVALAQDNVNLDTGSKALIALVPLAFAAGLVINALREMGVVGRGRKSNL